MSELKGKLKVVVCGTRFGRFYLEAIKQSHEFELAGIVSTGSAFSQKCAEKYGTKLYTDLEQLPSDVDIACVVIRTTVLGGEGTELALRLMNKGVHVLLEQPAHQRDLARCYQASRQNNVFFALGDLYVELPSVKKFILLAQGIIKQQTPLYLNIDLATQVSFPLVHILAKALPSLRPWKVESVINDDTPFQVVSMTIGGIPVVIRAHNQVDTEVSDGYLHLLHKISLGVGGGNLTLSDTHGPVTWQPRLIMPDDHYMPGDITTYPSDGMFDESTSLIGDEKYPTYEEIFNSLWPQAILNDLRRVASLIKGEIAEKQTAKWGQQEVLCSQLWHEISNALGYPNNCKNADKEYLSVSNAVGAYYEQLTMAERYVELSNKEVQQGIAILDKASLSAMLHQFQKYDVFVDGEKSYTEEEVIAALPVAEKHHYVMGRWLKALAENGLLVCEDDRYRAVGILINDDELSRQWKKARELWDYRLGSPLVSQYFYQNVQALQALMSDQKQAAMILFPEGKNDVANALYRETVFAWYLNQQVSAEVENLAQRTSQKITILEVGAGTGATSDVVIDNLQSTGLEESVESYLYTDISPYFFSEARSRYTETPWVTTRVVDLEEDLLEYGLEQQSIDVIVAVGVLNNVKDTVAVLKKLAALLTDEGKILITETDGESIQMLISQVFMMEAADDARMESDTTFLDKAQWIEIFNDAGLQLLNVMPKEDHKLACLNQRLFVLKK